MNSILRAVIPYAIAGVVGVVGVATYNSHQREIGRLQVLLHVADSAHRAAVAAAEVAEAEALRASQKAEEALRLYRRGQGVVAVTVARSDSARRVLASARDSALAAAADSSRTTGELRVVIVNLVTAGDSVKVVHEAERRVFVGRLALAGAALVADSLALAKGGQALTGMRIRAESAERQRDLYKKIMPSTFWRWTERIIWTGAVVCARTC